VAKRSRPKGTKKPSPAKATKTEPVKNAAPKAARRASITAKINPNDRVSLYAGARYLSAHVKQECKLQLQFATYFQDPTVALANPELAVADKLYVDWEPGLSDGPTSARFAIVDYNGDTGALAPPAEWNEKQQAFVYDGKTLDQADVGSLQFHQVSVWTTLQRALAFFEDGNGLGRRIPWAFEGNRLIVVPHAGYGENAFYDRDSRSLQFYYCGDADNPVYTCLSADIVNHEFGHAVLDGVRPYFNESSQVQTAAFHEFMGDWTAILLALRNNDLRKLLAEKTKGKLADAEAISSIAEEFGRVVSGKPYLRTANNEYKMSTFAGDSSPHRLSQVLTGAMFEIVTELATHYQREPDDPEAVESATPSEKTANSAATPAQAFWRAIERMQRMAIQPLDLLPPVDVTFRDYALAVCRAQQLSNPLDPHDYYGRLIKVFRRREILSALDEAELREPQYLYNRLQLTVRHNVDNIARSRAAAYRFLDDNREDLLIPANRDFIVCDLYDANKLTRQGVRMPRQIILEYVWREDVPLDGPQFGRFDGQVTTMLCGGTLVFDDNSIVLSWAHKPGSLPYGGKRVRRGHVAALWQEAIDRGVKRRQALLDNIAAQVANGRIGSVIGTEKGLMGTHLPPLIAESEDGNVQFRLSPHLHLSEKHQLDDDDSGERKWEISC
jgi:hypothetical protein